MKFDTKLRAILKPRYRLHKRTAVQQAQRHPEETARASERSSRRMAARSALASILRDARLRRAPQDDGCALARDIAQNPRPYSRVILIALSSVCFLFPTLYAAEIPPDDRRSGT